MQEKASAATARFNELSDLMKGLESQMNANGELQKQIVNYAKTRAVYVDYRKAGYSKKFRAEHEADILIHQAAKNILTARELQSYPLSKYCGKNMPGCWNRNGKPMPHTNRYGLICGNCKMSRRMWIIFWIFLLDGKHSLICRSHGNHRFFAYA